MPKKPWPRDVLIITASSGEFANTTAMAAVVRVRCRDCGRPLLASSFTIAVAAADPSRRGRAIDFLGYNCCYPNYNLFGVLTTDHSEGKHATGSN